MSAPVRPGSDAGRGGAAGRRVAARGRRRRGLRALAAVANLLRRLAHPLGDALRLQVARRASDGVALGRGLTLTAQLAQLPLESVGATGEPLLVDGGLPSGIAALGRFAGAREFLGETAFGVGELARLELQVAQLPPAIVGGRPSQSLLGLSQTLEGPFGVLAGPLRILLLQAAGGPTHVFGGVAQRLPVGAAAAGALVRLPLARLALPRLTLARRTAGARLALLTLLSLLPWLAFLLRRLVRRLPLAVGPLRHLPGQLLQLTAQRLLVARQTLEPPLHRLLVELLAIARQIALLAAHRFLAPGQLAQAGQRIVVGPLVLPGLGRGRRLVVGLLLLAQLLIEERRQVGCVPVPAAASAALLTRHLTAAHVGLGLEQLVEGLELVRHRGGRLQAIQFGGRPPHRLDGLAHRVVADVVRAVRPRRRRGSALGAPPSCVPASLAARCSRARWAAAMARTSSADWAVRARRPRASSFQVATTISFCAAARSCTPCDWPPAAMAWLCAATNSSSKALTSRKNMSLRVSDGGLPRPTSRARTK